MAAVKPYRQKEEKEEQEEGRKEGEDEKTKQKLRRRRRSKNKEEKEEEEEEEEKQDSILSITNKNVSNRILTSCQQHSRNSVQKQAAVDEEEQGQQ